MDKVKPKKRQKIIVFLLFSVAVLVVGIFFFCYYLPNSKSSQQETLVGDSKREFFDPLGSNPSFKKLCEYAKQRLQAVVAGLPTGWNVVYQTCSEGPAANQVTLDYEVNQVVTERFLGDLESAFEKGGYGVLRNWVEDGAFLLDEADGKGFLFVHGKFGGKSFSVIGQRQFGYVK